MLRFCLDLCITYDIVFHMPSIIKKKTKYSTYYVIAESARVDGKPRIVKQWYLGTIEKVIQLAENRVDKEVPREITCQEDGTISVLCRIAQELDLRNIINTHVRKRNQGMTPGDYILIAALNRAAGATSKSKIKEWVNGTTLHLQMKIELEKLDSQNFWDHFDLFNTPMIEAIGDELARKAIDLEKVPLDCLIYDTTNYFNYWDVLNPSELARMTKSKAGKNNLRHIGLALAVDRDWGLPLFHRLYPANDHDSTVFRKILTAFFEQISSVVSDKKAVTLVFDKGNNSEEAIVHLDESRHHFVGSRSPYHNMDLCAIPLEKYEPTEFLDGDGGSYSLPTIETRLDLYSKPRRVIVVYNEATFQRQCHRMEHHLEKAKAELSFFKKKAKIADGRSTEDSIRKIAQEIVEQHHVSGLLDIDVTENEDGWHVSARKNFPAIEEAKSRFGKQVLFSNRETVTRADIIKTYVDRAIVEDAFRITKSDSWVKWGPAFHWTDSKIRVHALTCTIALLLVRIAHKRARQAGFAYGAERMMELLSGVKSALIFYPQSKKPQRMLCSISKEQRALLINLGHKFKDRM